MSLSLQISCISKHYYPETLENLKKICQIAGMEFKLNEQATCCGLPYFEKGELKTAKTIGELNIELYKEHTVLCASSKCKSAFTFQYPKIFNNTVSHNAAVQMAKNTLGLKDVCDKLPESLYESISGHFFMVADCCSHSLANEYKKLLANCHWTKSSLQSDCCGAGTSMPSANQELANKITLNLILEFQDSKAEAMVFEDDICRKQVDIVAANSNIQIKTMHIIDLLMQNHA